MGERLNVVDAAELLGVSARQVYDLAAPNGPIPCFRIGRRVVFDRSDLEEYLQSCRHTKARRAVVSPLNSMAVLKANESALEKSFRKLGIEPKRKPSINEKKRAKG